MNPTSIHEGKDLIPGLVQWIRESSVAMSCGVGDLALLWLWYRPAAAALIGPLVWEPPDAAGAALKRQKKED